MFRPHRMPDAVFPPLPFPVKDVGEAGRLKPGEHTPRTKTRGQGGQLGLEATNEGVESRFGLREAWLSCGVIVTTRKDGDIGFMCCRGAE